MLYGNVSKSKYNSNISTVNKNIKQKENLIKMINSNANAIVVDTLVSKNVNSSFKPGINLVIGSKFRTSKNSPEKEPKTNVDERNFSEERKINVTRHILMQNYFNNNSNYTGNTNYNSNDKKFSKHKHPPKIKPDFEEENLGLDVLLKNKIMKNKEKIKTNIVNFTNPYPEENKKFVQFKHQLENSVQNSHPGYLNFLKKELEIPKYDDKNRDKHHNYNSNINFNSNYKKINSNFEDEEEIHSHRHKYKKTIVSPRIECVINKYREIFDKNHKDSLMNLGSNKLLVGSNVDWKKSLINNGKFLNNAYATNHPSNTILNKITLNKDFKPKIESNINLKSSNPKSKYLKQTNNSSHQSNGSQNSFNFQHIIPLNEIKITNTQKEQITITDRETHSKFYNKGDTKMNIGIKSNSRKNSTEKILLNNSNNVVKLFNPKNSLKASTNAPANISSFNLISNNNNFEHEKEVNLNNMNKINSYNLNSIIVTEESQIIKLPLTKPTTHIKMNSDVPVLATIKANFINPKNNLEISSLISSNIKKEFLYNNNLKLYSNKNFKNTKFSFNTSETNNQIKVSEKKNEESILDKSIKKKIEPLPIPISTNQSKTNSKSASRTEDFIEYNAHSSVYAIIKKNSSSFMPAKNPKSTSLSKKYTPVTTTHSPTLKDPISSKIKDKENHDDKINSILMKKNSESSNVISEKAKPFPMKMNIDLAKNDKKDNTYNTISNKKFEQEKLELMLENSCDSGMSTMRESNYYKRESEKISDYIKQYRLTYREYPKTLSQFYKYGRLLGRGAFGKVNLALHTATGKLVAIKSFNKNKLTSDNAKRKIVHETKILKTLNNSSSIVKFYETFETNKYIIIVMEYISCGDLLSFVRKRSKLNENIAKFVFKQIIEALLYIHSQNIVHRDIKLDNILIDINNNIKICDFGVSKQVKKGDLMHDQCGTPAYIAPEILKNLGYEGFGVDIWSAGVVLYAMLSGTVPFKANNLKELHKLIIKGTFPHLKDNSEEANNLILALLEVDPKKRLNIDQILNHPWIKSLDKLKAKMNLFTTAEKVLLSKSNVDYRYANKDDLIENFTIKNLDTKQETENKNIHTKSFILAPFNSSINVGYDSSLMNKEITIENDVLKFHGKIIELNRNYELNNNGEIDNGVIISPKGEDNNSNSKNISPIYSPYSPSPFHNSFNNNLNKIISQPVSPHEFENKGKISQVNSSREESNQKFLSNNLLPASNQSAIDDKIIRELEEIGYKRAYIRNCLINNELNYATAAYYLLARDQEGYL